MKGVLMRRGAAASSMETEEERERFDLKGRGIPVGLRKKGIGVRMWLVINSSGTPQVIEAGKHAIMRRTSLPARDLRILDPLLSYPSTILGRERAIVVNLEHIKTIISAHEVLLLNSKDPQVAPFVEDLRRRLPVHYNALGQQVPGDGGGGMSDNEMLDTTGPYSAEPNRQKGGPSALPFEFRALEACLEAACGCLDAEATALEQQAYPALDELTSKISTLNLERVRLIKSRLVAISGRVQKVRDEIEQLLDDDGDMAEMYLTDKLSRQQLEGMPSPSASDVDGHEEGDRDRFFQAEPFETMRESLVPQLQRKCSSSSSSEAGHGKQLDVEELEMLLEAYFVQVDGTLNKLSTLREYVDDTEDYINIMLDDKQNQLLQMGVMLTTATLVVSASIVVTGIFGMNISVSLFTNGTLTQFLWVVGGSSVGALVVYFLVIAWCKWQRLLE